MSIQIIGMEMPKDGEKLYVIVFSDGKACASYKPFEWHEVVPVPPHGRLIDANPIMKFIQDGLNNGEFGYDQIKVMGEIQYAPTIIPAEEGE